MSKYSYIRKYYSIEFSLVCLFGGILVGSCKCQYKNVGKVENKNVGFSTYSSVA